MQAIPTRDIIRRVGITPVCWITLAVYYATCLGLQQSLPEGEALIHSPLDFLPLLLAMIPLLCAFVVVREWRKQPRARDALAIALGLLVFLTTFWSFGYTKSLIPALVPYYLDPTLERLELWLHGGATPYQWLVPYFTPRMYYVLDKIYLIGWINVLGLYFFWQVFTPAHGKSRTIFLSSFTMSWLIVGNLLATLLSSVGPTFYGMFFHDQYTPMNAELVDHLASIKAQIGAYYEARNLVTDMHEGAAMTELNGISAMPSMHTAMCALMVIHSLTYHKKLAFFTIPFGLVIFIGSFMFGWHYALDTYVSVACVWVIWKWNLWSYARWVGEPIPPV